MICFRVVRKQANLTERVKKDALNDSFCLLARIRGRKRGSPVAWVILGGCYWKLGQYVAAAALRPPLALISRSRPHDLTSWPPSLQSTFYLKSFLIIRPRLVQRQPAPKSRTNVVIFIVNISTNSFKRFKN